MVVVEDVDKMVVMVEMVKMEMMQQGFLEVIMIVPVFIQREFFGMMYYTLNMEQMANLEGMEVREEKEEIGDTLVIV